MFPSVPTVKYLRLLFRSSADVIQWREKDLAPEQNREFVRVGVKLSRTTGKLFVVNSQIELALDERASAVHLTSAQEICEARRLQNSRGTRCLIVGKSVHSFKEGLQAEDQGADYILLSPILHPISKGFKGQPLGFGELRRVCSTLRIPVFALGGIDLSKCPEVERSGAGGVAGISWLRLEMESLIVHASTSTQGKEA